MIESDNLMISSKKLKILLSITIIFFLLLLIIYLSNSVLFRRVILLQWPDPVPEFILRVRPEPGSTIFGGESIKGENTSWVDQVCFALKDPLKDDQGNVYNAYLLDRVNMIINGQPTSVFHGGSEIKSITDSGAYCWEVILDHGDYIIEIDIEGKIYKHYEWAFRVREG